MKALVLIGMPASGKSTVGKLLARALGCGFSDGDDLIRLREGKPPGPLLAEHGAAWFLAAEERALCAIPEGRAVIATGGSAVYSARAMAHLKSLGTVVYLKLPERDVEERIPDFSARGVVMRGNISTLHELYAERVPLYERYADVTVDCTGRSPEEIAEELLHL